MRHSQNWAKLWHGYIRCHCSGIRRVLEPCPACGSLPYSVEPTIVIVNGVRHQMHAAFAGAEGRYEDWLYLGMMEREWKRPVLPEDIAIYSGARDVSPRASVVLLFWTYFETRIERLLRIGMRGTPEALIDDTLDRYQGIGARLTRLYQVLFTSTYAKDLERAGFKHIWTRLAQIQKSRNDFMHGKPEAIDDNLTEMVVDMLEEEHRAWIAVFNLQIAAENSKSNAGNNSNVNVPDGAA